EKVTNPTFVRNFPHATADDGMVWLILLALWVGVSLPLALAAGRLLQPRRRTTPVADAAEHYLRRRFWRHRVAGPAAVPTALAVAVGVVVLGNQAIQLPAARVAADRGLVRLGLATTTTTAPPPVATAPAASADDDEADDDGP